MILKLDKIVHYKDYFKRQVYKNSINDSIISRYLEFHQLHSSVFRIHILVLDYPSRP